VHLPISVLVAGATRRFRRWNGIRVDLERVIGKYKFGTTIRDIHLFK
jgi:hypothetical protein